MKQYKRSERFNKLLIEEVSQIVQQQLKDPRIGFVSFTRVETTEDLRSAKLYVSLLDEAQAPDTLEALRHAAGMIRGELMHRIKARRIPELRFVHDRSIAHSVHIAEVLDQLRRERAATPEAAPQAPPEGVREGGGQDDGRDEGGSGAP
jgi:ribosome-binding factor A